VLSAGRVGCRGYEALVRSHAHHAVRKIRPEQSDSVRAESLTGADLLL
jgi:hypothetical protein